MAPDMRRWLLDEAPNAVVATIGPSGRPQLTPNWFLWDGDVFWVSTGVETVKVRNLRRDSRITLCIDRSEPPETYVQITGTAEIIETEVRALTLPLIAKYVEGDDAIARHWDAMIGDPIMLRITPMRWQWFEPVEAATG